MPHTKVSRSHDSFPSYNTFFCIYCYLSISTVALMLCFLWELPLWGWLQQKHSQDLLSNIPSLLNQTLPLFSLILPEIQYDTPITQLHLSKIPSYSTISPWFWDSGSLHFYVREGLFQVHHETGQAQKNMVKLIHPLHLSTKSLTVFGVCEEMVEYQILIPKSIFIK